MNSGSSDVCFKRFSSSMKTWDNLCGDAAKFAATIGPERLISISHSQEGLHGLVVVWYWDR